MVSHQHSNDVMVHFGLRSGSRWSMMDIHYSFLSWSWTEMEMSSNNNGQKEERVGDGDRHPSGHLARARARTPG